MRGRKQSSRRVSTGSIATWNSFLGPTISDHVYRRSGDDQKFEGRTRSRTGGRRRSLNRWQSIGRLAGQERMLWTHSSIKRVAYITIPRCHSSARRAAHYRIRTDAKDSALAGLSVGGYQTVFHGSLVPFPKQISKFHRQVVPLGRPRPLVLVLVVVLPTSPRRLKLREATSGRLSSIFAHAQ